MPKETQVFHCEYNDLIMLGNDIFRIVGMPTTSDRSVTVRRRFFKSDGKWCVYGKPDDNKLDENMNPYAMVTRVSIEIVVTPCDVS